jgi:hypothetical protein
MSKTVIIMAVSVVSVCLLLLCSLSCIVYNSPSCTVVLCKSEECHLQGFCTAGTIKDVAICDGTPCGSSKRNRRLAATYSFHLQGDETFESS